MPETEAGKISHYFGRPGVGMVAVSDTLKVGDNIHIKGSSTDITMTIESMTVDKVVVTEAVAGKTAGIKVPGKVSDGDVVFKVTP